MVPTGNRTEGIMVFSSLVFLFVYLPIVFAVYYLVPRAARNIWLFIVNIVFYGWGEPLFVFLMLATTIVNFFFGVQIDRFREKAPKVANLWLVLAIVIDLGILGYFKYCGFMIRILNRFPVFNIPMINVSLPIGISFYTFQIISYIIDVYTGKAESQKSIISFGTYVFLFPQLIAGPILRYSDIAEQIDHRRESLPKFYHGIVLFCIGLAKKVLLANPCGALWNSIRAVGEKRGILGSWVGLIAYTFQIYYDFSGYSDMAIGLGSMMGFSFMKNFDYPYIAQSITDFWRRWHISLSTWFRDYVYIPLGGNRKGFPRQIVNLFIVWSLTGLWHGANWNFILWGLYYFVLLVAEKLFFGKVLNRLPRVFRHLLSLCLIAIGWCIFYFEDTGALGAYLISLFNPDGVVIGAQTAVIALRYLSTLLIAAVASTPLVAKLTRKRHFFDRNPLLRPIFCALVLLLCTAALVNESYNPFLYFRF